MKIRRFYPSMQRVQTRATGFGNGVMRAFISGSRELFQQSLPGQPVRHMAQNIGLNGDASGHRVLRAL